VLEVGEWKTLEAITGRILPRDHEPGAIEAGCVNFIDEALAHEDAAALPLYRFGLAAIDAAAGERFGAAFTALGPVQQDELLAALEAGSASGWPAGPVPSPVFFETVRLHTLLGFLADPRYGGNRGEVGWRVAGYPGPRHRHGGFSAEQLRGAAPVTAPGRSRP
jgi:gluconate 2-dehydrogenase gamma chain